MRQTNERGQHGTGVLIATNIPSGGVMCSTCWLKCKGSLWKAFRFGSTLNKGLFRFPLDSIIIIFCALNPQIRKLNQQQNSNRRCISQNGTFRLHALAFSSLSDHVSILGCEQRTYVNPICSVPLDLRSLSTAAAASTSIAAERPILGAPCLRCLPCSLSPSVSPFKRTKPDN